MTNQTTHPRHSTWRTKYGAWAIVTGASDGIGRAIALDLAVRGLNLILVARRRVLLEEFAADLSRQHAIETLVIDADLTQAAGLEKVIAASEPLQVGLLVACAGFGTSGRLTDAPLEQELAMLDVNVRAVLVLTHHFARRFAQQGHGGIVLMSSLLAFQGVPGAANYAATKAYIQTLAEGLRHELAPVGVDVVASAPGPIHSGFAARANLHMSMALQPDVVAHGTLAALGHRTTARPGWLSKFLERSLALLPRSGRVRALGAVMAGMTKHQTDHLRTSRHGTT